jgi:hypothetical protein
VLGYTNWAPELVISPLMHYVTEVGQQLFSYPGITPGQFLDFTHFWGGRSSCTRQFLLDHGMFNPRFTSIIEDIELGYRLSRFGLRVLYQPAAISFMARGFTFDECAARSERRGRALALFDRLHDDTCVTAFCRVREQSDLWSEAAGSLDENVARLTVLEGGLKGAGRRDDEALDELHRLYGWVLAAHQARGVAEVVNELQGL